MHKLFLPLKIREVEFQNRIFLAPMCQYSGEDGQPTDWHFVHLGSRAVGGASLIMSEACAVSPDGRITLRDLGIWSDRQIEPYKRLCGFIQEQGGVPGIQLAHAGRKASTRLPWEGGGPLPPGQGGWKALAPSPLPYAPNFPLPEKLTSSQLETLAGQFEAAASRAALAGFEVLELHMAHGYLLHEFLSPVSNRRQDEFGGAFENRCRFPLEIARRVRAVWPRPLPLFVRISATDWIDGGWNPGDSVRFCLELKKLGIDLVDCSTGGISAEAKPPMAPCYQVRFAHQIRHNVDILTGAAGLITEARQAEEILRKKEADAIFLGRALLENPYWPRKAAQELAVPFPWPRQYSFDHRAPKEISAISLLEFQAMVQNESLVILDVRTSAEYFDGHIPGSIHVPLEELLSFASGLPPETPRSIWVITIANTGKGRGLRAARILQANGWKNARCLEGGYGQWSALGLPEIGAGSLSA